MQDKEKEKKIGYYGGLNPPDDWGWHNSRSRRRLLSELLNLHNQGYLVGPWVFEEARKLGLIAANED